VSPLIYGNDNSMRLTKVISVHVGSGDHRVLIVRVAIQLGCFISSSFISSERKPGKRPDSARMKEHSRVQ
jgi:hypothetical protein